MALDSTNTPAKQSAGTLRGFIDGIRPSGYIEGWAQDDSRPWVPQTVMVRFNGRWVAEGLAHHFREDLLGANIGIGWCGFTLRTAANPAELSRATLFLVGQSGAIIQKAERPPVLREDMREHHNTADITGADPTVVYAIEHLRCCASMFTAFVDAYGVEAFVRNAYVYVLNRPADEAGLSLYSYRLRVGVHAPFELLQILAASDEFISRRPPLIAPTQRSFPFLVA